MPFYDRSDLVHETVLTVERNLLRGMLLVVVILIFFLYDVRSGLIVAVTIPLVLAVRLRLPRPARTRPRTCCRSARSTSESWSMPR